MKGLRISGIIAACVIGCAVLGALCVGSGVALDEATTCAAGDVIFGGTISIQGAVFGGSVGFAIGCVISIMAVGLYFGDRFSRGRRS